jgi:hypothetical protein
VCKGCLGRSSLKPKSETRNPNLAKPEPNKIEKETAEYAKYAEKLHLLPMFPRIPCIPRFKKLKPFCARFKNNEAQQIGRKKLKGSKPSGL